MTIADVAAEAGVSVATVSKVINGRCGVAEETEARVRAVIERARVHSSLVAQSLRSRRTNVIGVLVVGHRAVQRRAAQGRRTGDPRHRLRARRLLRTAGAATTRWAGSGATSRESATLCDGAILVTPSSVDVTFGAPVVAVDHNVRLVESPDASTPTTSTARSTATEHLLGLGHRRIGFLAGRPDLESAQLRERGYRQALETRRHPGRPRPWSGSAATSRTGRGRARELLERDDRPTAIFAANDVSAIATIAVARVARARRAGRSLRDRVRQRPGVGAQRAAADDDRAADPADGLRGRAAADRPDRGSRARREHDVLPTRLVVRGSSVRSAGAGVTTTSRSPADAPTATPHAPSRSASRTCSAA